MSGLTSPKNGKMIMENEIYQNLMISAEEARNGAYTPYSHFKVGAALLCKDGKVYTGCNIENAAFTPTVCAERVAFFKAVSDGEKDFVAIAIVGGREKDSASFCAPCGVCRQVMAEFVNENFKILLGNSTGFKAYALNELLPFAFTGKEI